MTSLHAPAREPVAQAAATTPAPLSPQRLTHLQQLEAESIHILREVAAEFSNPVMLYSIGKDSSVMLHLARKAFYPGPPPFPLMHINTTWKFREMIEFRDRMAADVGMELIEHINEEGRAAGINPFDHGSSGYTDVMKTEALKQALDKHGFDAAFGGARRDEEASRAKERVFSFRDKFHRWIPRTSVRSCGTSTTPGSTRASRFVPSRSPTGPSWTSGSTSIWSRSPSCRFTTPHRAR
ncbi:hypothetical protein Q427_04125 [Halomonas sp. BC04]|nr:hypothetical protein Q427_04125 [Halomonas sp. BC04]